MTPALALAPKYLLIPPSPDAGSDYASLGT